MLLKGNVVAKTINTKIREMELPELVLAVFHPLGDESADSYLRMKEKKLKKAGFATKVIPVPQATVTTSGITPFSCKHL